MKIAILTSGILPVPAVQGGAVETRVGHLLEYNDLHKLHDITIFSVYHPAVKGHQLLKSDVNHFEYVDTSSIIARIRKRIHGLLHSGTYYHNNIDYFFQQTLSRMKRHHFDCIVAANRPGYGLQLKEGTDAKIVYLLGNDFLNNMVPHSAELYQAASMIVANSNFIRGRVQTCNPSDTKCVTVYNGIDLAPFSVSPNITRISLGYSQEDFILAYSGRLIPEKGIMELIDAMNIIKDRAHIKLLVMGSSFYENGSNDNPFIAKLKEKADNISDRILFTGYIKHDLIADYLRLADVAIIPSTWEEPFGLTVVEGMAAGLPIITTNRGGIPELVTKDNAIILHTDEHFVYNLSSAILDLFEHPGKREKMSKASLERSKLFSKERYAREFFEALELWIK